ncbi:outer envelope pore protein 24A, chloroplastic-like [Pistacia vera]|uniref:outer envelope pore protein 24A, chloroplastic-like n=1 Tax=Pistacia vera TaxID=55513 RepID=UPI0012634425|nr:outer envelope pore protein 24A, chloroplastic-like [Pistacia vera]
MNAAISMRSKRGLTGTVAADAGDLKLRAYVSFVPAISASDLSLSVEKPGSFLIDFDVPQKDIKFQFMNTARVLEKQLNMTYTHWRGENRTILDGTLVLDHNNKISASYAIDSSNCKLKYSHVHRGVFTFEPCYDFGKNSWELALSKTVLDGDVIKASYVTSSKALELQWIWKSSFNKDGRCKVSASFNLAEGLHTPTLTAESFWNFEM